MSVGGWPVRLKTDTIGRLKKLGRMGDSYDDVVRRLIKVYEDKKK